MSNLHEFFLLDHVEIRIGESADIRGRLTCAAVLAGPELISKDITFSCNDGLVVSKYFYFNRSVISDDVDFDDFLAWNVPV